MKRAVPAIRYLDTVTSTMDVAKEWITLSSSSSGSMSGAPPSETSKSPMLLPVVAGEPFAVVAKVQTHGRGTSSKHWASPSGNLMLTIAVPMERIAAEVLPVLPLMVGISVREAVQKCSGLGAGAGHHEVRDVVTQAKDGTTSPPPQAIMAKWPNDTVWEGRKLSGSLIETVEAYMLIGIGVNVETAPEVADGGRPTVCLKEIMRSCRSPRMIGPTLSELAEAVWEELFRLLERAETQEIGRGHIVQRFSSIMNWNLTLYKRNEQRTPVRAVRMNAWGHLVVVPATSDACTAPHNGDSEDVRPSNEEVLMSEYLF